jgi:UPF0755 protein
MSNKKSLQFKAGFIITIAVLFSTFSFYGYQLFFTPNIQLERKPVYLYIPTGATFDVVKDSLEKMDALNNKVSFYFLSKLLKYRDNVKPGRYLLDSSSNNFNILKKLKQGRQAPVKLTFNNIRLKSELAKRLSDKLEFSEEDLLKRLNEESIVRNYGFTTENIIGMFIPNTYEFYWNIPVEKFIERMHGEYLKFWTEERKDKARSMGLTPAEVTIVASIVEAETNYEKEKSRVAGVYINRLRNNMPLQADPTVKFALGDFTIKRIYSGHIEYDSPYNTYMYAGLPPGPINLPSTSTVDAVLNYERHKYIYFCAHHDLSGHHDFAETYAEHQIIAEKYRKALNKLQIK